MKLTFSNLIKIALATILLLGFLHIQKNYYLLFRGIFLLAGFAILAYYEYKKENVTMTIVYFVLALLFTPFIPKLKHGSEVWIIVEAIVAVGLIATLFIQKKTETEIKKSFVKIIPSLVLAFVTLIGATIVLFVADELVHSFDPGGKTAIVLFFILITAACFFIVKNNPNSIWYVPAICNVPFIISAFVEPNFWRGIDWIFVLSGWFLSIIASFLGARAGRRAIARKVKEEAPNGQ